MHMQSQRILWQPEQRLRYTGSHVVQTFSYFMPLLVLLPHFPQECSLQEGLAHDWPQVLAQVVGCWDELVILTSGSASFEALVHARGNPVHVIDDCLAVGLKCDLPRQRIET